MITRFAPSPTGYLHLGHAYSAVLAYRRAQESGGRFLLRFEDIDYTRVREEFYGGIEEDLAWLGLSWEGAPWRQLQRMEAYEGALGQLRDRGHLYRCFCTRRDLAQAAAAPQEGDGAVRYRGTCRLLDREAVAEKLAAGRPFSWRMNMVRAAAEVGPLTFREKEKGVIKVDPYLTGDPVLARKDIATSYHLAVVVDDAAQGVTEVTRGSDLADSTHLHRVLQELLGLPAPDYWHHRLVVNDEGRRLAKREHSLAIRTLREGGASPEEVMRRAVQCVR